jgi:hypothetical protein
MGFIVELCRFRLVKVGASMRQVLFMMMTLVIWLNPVGAWAEDARRADHDTLKALLKTTQQAFNTKNFDLIKPYIAKEHFTVITIDGNKFESLEAFRQYWNDILKNNKTGLARIEVNPVADGPTEFLADKVGICHGTSNDRYFFTSGDVLTMPERWTAVVLNEDGVWKVSRIIFSANILDNPVLTSTKDALQKFILLAALAGLLVGAFGMWLFRCRKAA